MGLKVNDLKGIGFFENYRDVHLKVFLKFSSIREFNTKDILFEQYEHLSDIYILLEGTLALGISLPMEKRVRLSNIQPGQLFSWSAMFEPGISTACVKAISSGKILTVNAEKLQKEFKKDYEFGFLTISKIAMTISHRLADTRFHLMNLLNI